MTWLEIFLIVVCVGLVILPRKYDPAIRLKEKNEAARLAARKEAPMKPDELAARGAPHRIWTFDRYVNGVLMAEGVEITRANSFEEACVSAARLASRGPNGEVPVLVLSTPAALAASPEVAKLIREAVEAERKRLLKPDPGFVCECGLSGPCMAEDCKSPLLDMAAAMKGETT